MRYLMFTLVAVAGLIDIGSANANWTIAPPGSEKSKEIASENIMERPNRPLHVYGTWVRWTHRRDQSN
jgi:hypothetical protein